LTVIIYGGYSAVCLWCYFFFLEIPQSKNRVFFHYRIFRKAKVILLFVVRYSAEQK